jgi:hypothetical protein
MSQTGRLGRPGRVGFNRVLCFRYYRDPPPLDVHSLPPHVKITIPPDGGFWLVDRRTGIRYRRVTMDDLPKGVSWNTRRKADQEAAE